MFPSVNEFLINKKRKSETWISWTRNFVTAGSNGSVVIDAFWCTDGTEITNIGTKLGVSCVNPRANGPSKSSPSARRENQKKKSANKRGSRRWRGDDTGIEFKENCALYQKRPYLKPLSLSDRFNKYAIFFKRRTKNELFHFLPWPVEIN